MILYLQRYTVTNRMLPLKKQRKREKRNGGRYPQGNGGQQSARSKADHATNPPQLTMNMSMEHEQRAYALSTKAITPTLSAQNDSDLNTSSKASLTTYLMTTGIHHGRNSARNESPRHRTKSLETSITL